MDPDVVAVYFLRSTQVDIEHTIHSMWTVRHVLPQGTHTISVSREDERLAKTMLSLLQMTVFACALAVLHHNRPDIF